MKPVLAQIEQSLSQRLASFCTGEEEGKRVKAFFGPTGVGNTTTIAKLASLYSLERKVDVGLMTKIDECPRAGFVYNVVDQLAKPVSYVTNGQNVPFDIEKASPASMARLIVRNTLH